MKYFNDIRELIGHTPLLKLNHSQMPSHTEVFAKLESWNPGGSIKDRMGVAMVKDAEEKERLHPGDTLLEVTAGNAGIGIALAALGRGYNVVFVVPEKFSQEKQDIMRAYGATIVHTPRDKGMQGAFEKAEELKRTLPHVVELGQFSNPTNPRVHFEQTGPEIWDDLDGNVDFLVAGAGSGGTISGAGRYLKGRNPRLRIILADPVGSTIGGGEPGCYSIEGIGNTFMPETMDTALVDEVVKVTDDEALAEVRALAHDEGLIVGTSSGAALTAVRAIAKKAPAGSRIVAIIPDRGDRYFSKHILIDDKDTSSSIEDAQLTVEKGSL
jgi:cysteine synthase A